MHYGQHRKRSSPRSWGCFLNGLCEKFTSPCLPHARGGVSFGAVEADPATVSSPRSWGCFHYPSGQSGSWRVFPTLVGVFPPIIHTSEIQNRLPHARGGVSTRGEIKWLLITVFPTLVGVFLNFGPAPAHLARLPHARGGVSLNLAVIWTPFQSSPRSWGCSQLC